MTVSIVILNWNGEGFLRKFLPILVERTPETDTEIVVADNGSTDNSVQLIKNEFPTVRIIQLDKNYGFAGGYNLALKQTDAEYYVILNSDVEVTENWLQPMLGYMNEHPEVAACQPKILSFDEPSKFEHAGAAGGFIDKYGYPFCRGRVFGVTEEDFGQYNDIRDIFWATGACLFIRSAVFHKVGGFDSEFFAHMEEIDLCWRLKSRGHRIVCIPQSAVLHVGGGTLHTEHPRKTYLNFRNNLLLLYKNLPNSNVKKILRIRFFLDYTAAIQLFINGYAKNAQSVFAARRDFKKILPSFKDKRDDNIRHAITHQFAEMLNKSIIPEYYLKKKQTFNKIFNNL